MNVKLLTIAVLIASLSTSCGGSNHQGQEAETAETIETPAATTLTYNVDATNSSIAWKGEVAGVYGHTGLTTIKEGTVAVTDGAITGGEITIDMSTIAATDSASYSDEKGHTIADLEGHLTTGDFFNVGEFPTSTFEITAINGLTITGDLTVKGKTSSETFTVEASEVTDNKVTLTGSLKFDRQKYGVAWVHYMKDMVLSDDISLTIAITATK